MAVRIAAISDIHYSSSKPSSIPVRRSQLSDILLLRAVHRINRYIKPDLVLVLGDLIDDGDSPEAWADLKAVKEVMDLLLCQSIVIPGNHDGDLDRFYSVFSRPPDIVDIREVRFLPFIDPEAPGYNAIRDKAGLDRPSQARLGWNGPMVSLQHVPVFAPGSSRSPYSYANMADVWESLRSSGVTLSISGHWHEGEDLSGQGAVICPGLCEAPFAFLEIGIDNSNITVTRHELALPSDLNLFDLHIHTPLAYCQENMDVDKTIALASAVGLTGFAFTEHTGQLYFDPGAFWTADFMKEGIDTRQGLIYRMGSYRRIIEDACPPALSGLEIDCDYKGRPVLKDGDLESIKVRVGSIHWLEALECVGGSWKEAETEYLHRIEKFLPCGIDILAHPFRLFRKAGREPSRDFMEKLARLLKNTSVAAEVNFHTDQPYPEFYEICLNSGVKLSFGSDSHNLYEVGELWPHLEMMKSLGVGKSTLAESLIKL